MAYDIAQPYGPPIETTVRVATWNVWGRYGPWEDRERAIASVLAAYDPDIALLTEAWQAAGDDQAARLGARLGLPHRAFRGEMADQEVSSGIAVLSRWPLAGDVHAVRLGDEKGWDSGYVLLATVEGPRGPVRLAGVMLAWKLGDSGRRQRQVRELAAIVKEHADPAAPLVMCGDFNAGPDSDEIRMLTGRAEVAARGLVFYDAWELAGAGGPGHTWANANPWAAPVLWPDRRIDYILSAWPRAGGAGHPVRCEVIGTAPVDGVSPSDHHGVVADLRY